VEWLGRELRCLGITVGGRSTVGDDIEAISARLRLARDRAALVLVTGGIGPTVDDRTREGFARALGVGIERDASMQARLEDRFLAAGREWNAVQARQADRPRGCGFIDNPLGTAPGLLWTEADSLIAALPGVPAEMQAMFDATLRPLLAERRRGAVASTVLRVAGRTESSVDAQLQDLYDEPGMQVTLLGSAHGLQVIVVASGGDQARADAACAELVGRMRERLGEDLYGEGDETLAAVVGRLLRERGATLSTAESCTAGLLAAALTDVPGASAWFRGGVVAYADDLKTALAGVDPSTLSATGAVSTAVAGELAAGARRRCGTDFALAVTGIAGPSGATSQKPLGLVCLALASSHGIETWEERFSGDRATVRCRAVTQALDRLRRHLARTVS
jgi:nicotinamide-nucleotide amidase